MSNGRGRHWPSQRNGRVVRQTPPTCLTLPPPLFAFLTRHPLPPFLLPTVCPPPFTPSHSLLSYVPQPPPPSLPLPPCYPTTRNPPFLPYAPPSHFSLALNPILCPPAPTSLPPTPSLLPYHPQSSPPYRIPFLLLSLFIFPSPSLIPLNCT